MFYSRASYFANTDCPPILMADEYSVFTSPGYLLIATTLEVSGDAIIRTAIFTHVGLALESLLCWAGQPSSSAMALRLIWRR